MEKTVKKIVPRPFHMASVEIIIPFHGEQAKVTSLIENIFQTVHTNKYLVTLVDDCSVNKNFLKDIEKAKIAGVRCLRQERHNGFGAAVNLALKTPFRVNPTYVCILQSDVTLHDAAWLSNLGHSLLSNNQIGMISPLTDNPVIESPILTAKRDEKRKDSILNEGYLPMYCVLANRNLFSQVGLLSECPYAGIEAEEFASRMKKKGFQQGVCGTSWVHHQGRATLSRFDNNEKVQKELQDVKEDFEKFLAKA